MTFGPLALLAAITLVVVVWFESLRMREHVTRRCHGICESSSLQLLDGSVALDGIGLKRDGSGRWRLQRRYRFYVSDNGADRWPGEIILTGYRIEAVHIEGESGTTILYENQPLQLH